MTWPIRAGVGGTREYTVARSGRSPDYRRGTPWRQTPIQTEPTTSGAAQQISGPSATELAPNISGRGTGPLPAT
jgi:hypothetical protein